MIRFVGTSSGEAEMNETEGERRDERLKSYDSAIMTLSAGQKLPGNIVDMSMGGMLFEVEGLLPDIPKDDPVNITMNLYGRETSFACLVAYHRGNCIGLILQRK